MDRRTFISRAGVVVALGHPLIASSSPPSILEAEIAESAKSKGPITAGNHTHPKPVIKMIGVGGFGCNAVNHMTDRRFTGINCISVDSDWRVLKHNKAEDILDLNGMSGHRYSFDRGGGVEQQINRNAAKKARGRLTEMLQGADVLFLAVGMGGSTVSGAAPVIAEIARDMGVLTVVFATTPFAFEGYRNELAEATIESLKPLTDSVMILPNDRLLGKLGAGASPMDAFMTSTAFFNAAICDVADAIRSPGLVSIDFADVRTFMSDSGLGMSATGWGNGAARAQGAAAEAIQSLLSDGVTLNSARGVLVNVASSGSLKISEVHQVMRFIGSRTAKDATVIYGSGINEYCSDSLVVTIVATGFPG